MKKNTEYEKQKSRRVTSEIIAGGGETSRLFHHGEMRLANNKNRQERLQDNSGFEFSQHEAGTIADTLQKMVDDGTAKAREEVNKRDMAVAEEWNKGINAQQEELEKEVKNDNRRR